MRPSSTKALALLAFNLAVLVVGTYLLTFTATESVTTPAGSLQAKTFRPYDFDHTKFLGGGPWPGLTMLLLVGNLALVFGMKVESEKTATPSVK